MLTFFNRKDNSHHFKILIYNLALVFLCFFLLLLLFVIIIHTFIINLYKNLSKDMFKKNYTLKNPIYFYSHKHHLGYKV